MPRQVVLLFWGVLFLTGLGAQGLETPSARWVLSGPAEVVPGQPFVVKAEVRLPAGYYQDSDSPFLLFEPDFPAEVTARSSSAPVLRAGKTSFSGSFVLTRTLVLPAGTPAGTKGYSFRLGWQICQVDGVCLLPAEAAQTLSLSVAGSSAGSGIGAIGGALLGALLGGLLLNLMPCVFPVLALKALALASSAGSSRSQRRREALAFAAGGFLSVLTIGLATGGLAALGQRLDWGFPFQQPGFVWFLVAVFGALTLPLLGLGRGWAPFLLTRPVHRSPGGVLSSLGSGAFLVLAAAPCTAPLLGPALGFALARPAWEIPLYFAAIGLGLVLPLLLLQIFPDWGRYLPRSGRWLKVSERAAGVLLAGTTVYLAWVLAALAGTNAAFALVALGLAGLLALGASRIRRPAGTVLRGAALVALAAGALVVVVPQAPESRPLADGWKPFTPTLLAEARAAGPVLVDATAAWCATCQVNELAVLGRPDVLALLDAHGVVRLRADYTRPDPAIHRWLAEVGRAGLPVYALYRPGQPVYLFSELLTDQNFTQVLPGLLAP